jgi:lysophospholipase L1-like esterase
LQAAASIAAMILLSTAARADDPAPLDPGQATAIDGDPHQWYDIRPLGVEGQGWPAEAKSPYDRLPARAEGIVRAPVWSLGQHSAGLCVRFVTDAGSIAARWTLRSESLAMNHMPATGVSGLDLYGRAPDGAWAWLAVGRPDHRENRQTLVEGLSAARREYLLYLPLYNGVEQVQIGIPAGAKVYPPAARPAAAARPIVFYGTSIVQGGCAARPGMAYPAIVGRWLDRPTINLGFSGNGPMELELARLLAELDAAAYVIDCLPNMSAAQVPERTGPLVRTLREARPDAPIVLVENIVYQNAPLVPASRDAYQAKNAALRKEYERLVSEGVTGLTYVPGDALLGDDGEGTVDGTHPTDLGFLRMAGVLAPVLRPLVGDGRGTP